MPAPIPTQTPLEVVRGYTWRWRRELPPYPAGEWSMLYYFDDSAGVTTTLIGSADGAGFLFSLSAVESTVWAAGRYAWQLQANELSTGETFQVEAGTLVVKESAFWGDISAESSSHALRMVAAIEATLENRATTDQQSYTIAGRSLARIPFEELLRARARYLLEARSVNRHAERGSRKGGSSKIGVRF